MSARVLGLAAAVIASGSSLKAEVSVEPAEKSIRIEVNGSLFTEYHFGDVERPYFYPVIGPGGAPMTRNYPITEATEGEAEDHPHHTGLWFTHGDVNGRDFWHDNPIKHSRLIEYTSGTDEGGFTVENDWIGDDGAAIATDRRVFTVVDRGDDEAPLAQYRITITAGAEDVTFGDTKEGSMAIRLAATMRLKGEVGQGHIVNSSGDRDGDTWGKRAAWCDYYGPVNGETVGVAIFDHPDNPRHPTWWHVRDYGLFAANPFGISYFDDKPRGTGDLSLPAGESVTWTYGFYFHEGTTEEAEVGAIYDGWAH